MKQFGAEPGASIIAVAYGGAKAAIVSLTQRVGAEEAAWITGVILGVNSGAVMV